MSGRSGFSAVVDVEGDGGEDLNPTTICCCLFDDKLTDGHVSLCPVVEVREMKSCPDDCAFC